ncbi:MFS transporter [Edaphobacter aggregans]|uniref:MFS transporter n=1 Tax=Edaphobacter aggregans TaxID=570835 RepID=UPI001FDF5C6E|nr:MFS transporter [Edaphobacter aggregans]
MLAATILGSGMAFIDGTVVNVALPALQNAFRASLADVQWVVEAYALMLAALLLVGGSLGDIFGRRRVYVFGVAVFAAASAWCGVARNIDMLIWARSIQGLGAAFLVPGSLALITASFPENARGHAIGTWSGFSSITAAIGPVIGGWLIEHSTWRWVFFLNLPLALIVILLCTRVPESRNENASHHLDWLGALLATLGLGGVTYALIEWPTHARHKGHLVIAAAGLGVLALVTFVAVEHWSRAPMVSLKLFRSRNFAGANLLTLFLYASLGGLMFFFPMDLIQIQHYTATQAGAAFLPLIAIMFGLSRWAGGLVARYGSRLPLTVGPFIAACGIALFAVVPQSSSYWATFFPAVVVMGLGMATSVAPLTTTVMNAVPESESGLASGINNAVSRLAALLAVAVFGAILVTVFNHSLDRRLAQLALDPEVRAQVDAARPQLASAYNPDPRVQHAITMSFLSGYRAVIWIATGLAVLGGIAARLLIESGAPSPAERG